MTESASDKYFVIPVRLIRSFEHRNVKTIVMKDVNPEQSVQEFQKRIDLAIETYPGLPPPFRKHKYDCLKIHHHAHKAKTNELLIDTSNDETLILQSEKTLQQSRVSNETELSYFKREDYEHFKANPNFKW